MFMPKRPEASAARKELQKNVTYFAAAVLVIRAAPFVLEFLQSIRA
jgi:hypothetical protein